MSLKIFCLLFILLFFLTKTNSQKFTGTTPNNDAERAKAIKEAMLHSWRNYKRYAFGSDEIRPVTRDILNWVPGGIAMTMIDSLDTLLIMDLREEFDQSVDWISKFLSFDKNYGISVFETTIRILGGLLSGMHYFQIWYL